MQLNHDRRGQGPPLVLVHGIGSQWAVWAPVLERLAEQRDVISIDLPGFGDSPPLPAKTTPDIAALADAVTGFVGELGVERPHVGGNSLGGWIALELARRGAVASATALSPAGFWNPREAAYARTSLASAVRGARAMNGLAPVLTATSAGRTLLFGQVMARPWRLSPQEALSALRALAGSPSFDETLEVIGSQHFRGGQEITVPTTVAWGERDWLLIPRQARRAARAIPSARNLTLKGCGHVPTWDDPEQVAGVLLEASAA